ncbi:RNA polymerase sigma factor [Arthrobacter sp. CAN_A212]|uniref:RNA polymerase sigma factor n=1 Tax=Arthrobacter sp. CAN_A212 TaxID=2787719 RepID=UPI002FF087D7
MNTDAEIVERSRYGPAAFGELYDRHAADIYRYAARRAGDFVAEDVMAETFLIAFERRSDFVGSTDGVRPWLFGIATNLLRRHHRAESRVLRALVKLGARAEASDVLDDIDTRLDAPGNQAHIARALDCCGDLGQWALLKWGFY